MFRNYIITAIRNLSRNNVFTFINIFGLAIGLTSVIVIFLLLEFELSFDKYHKKSKNIFRVLDVYTHSGGTDVSGTTCYPLAKAIRLEFPDIPATYMSHEYQIDVKVNENVYNQDNIVIADSLFFDFFDFRWISGNAETSLNSPDDVILTRSIAEKYFPNQDPIGRIIRFDAKYDMVIKGIIEDSPPNSSIPIEMIISSGIYKKGFRSGLDTWYTAFSGMCTFVQLPENVSTDDFKKQLKQQIVNKYYSKSVVDLIDYDLQAFEKLHFEADYANINNTYTTDLKFIWILIIIGFVILTLASINYVNLSTAQSLKRTKEIGIRKVSGAQGIQIFKQFIFETFIITFIALVISLILAEIFLPYLNEFIGYQVSLSIYNSKAVIIFLVFILLITTLLSGAYPAIYVSGFRPIFAIRNSFKGSRTGLFNLRRLLIIVQFFISIVLIVCTIVMINQVNYFKNKDLGFDKSDIVVFSIPDTESKNIDAIRQKVISIPGINNYSFSIGSPTSDNSRQSDITSLELENSERFMVNLKLADTNYTNMFNLKILAGNSHSIPLSDSLFPMVVNEKLIHYLGIDSPEEALGHRIGAGNFNGYICGVVKDFHVASLQNPISPVAIFYAPEGFSRLLFKVYPEQKAEVINELEKEWSVIFPDFTCDYFTLEESLGQFYDEENKTKTMIQFFMYVAIIIACLGLFGMVSFILVRKTKEIGIRKVLGANVSGIVMTISKEFFILIIISNLLAIPVSWYIMNGWLEQFTYRVSISWWIFVVAAIGSLLLILITICYHAIKAALSNPVDALRHE